MMKAAFDPVTLATPFFILTVILEIVLARFGQGEGELRDQGHRGLAGHGPGLQRGRAC